MWAAEVFVERGELGDAVGGLAGLVVLKNEDGKMWGETRGKQARALGSVQAEPRLAVCGAAQLSSKMGAVKTTGSQEGHHSNQAMSSGPALLPQLSHLPESLWVFPRTQSQEAHLPGREILAASGFRGPLTCSEPLQPHTHQNKVGEPDLP